MLCAPVSLSQARVGSALVPIFAGKTTKTFHFMEASNFQFLNDTGQRSLVHMIIGSKFRVPLSGEKAAHSFGDFTNAAGAAFKTTAGNCALPSSTYAGPMISCSDFVQTEL
jgi:hypothetical protein